MRLSLLIALSLSLSVQVLSQTAALSISQRLKDPRGLLIEARPQYDYSDPGLKPWALSGTYQLFDIAGKPSQKGRYALSWKAPGVYRSNWSRDGMTRTDWHTADGRALQQSSGDRLFYFEHALETLLLFALPDVSSLDKNVFQISSDEIDINKWRLPCAVIKRDPRSKEKRTSISYGPSGTYCFDSSLPLLRIEKLFGTVDVELNDLVRIQNRILPREVRITDGKHAMLTFEADKIGNLSDTGGFEPSVDAKSFFSLEPSVECQGETAIKKVPPNYPVTARAARVAGTVILDVVTDNEGKVTDIRPISSASSQLTPAAKEAVAQWQYSPCLLGRQPQELNRIINVEFMFP